MTRGCKPRPALKVPPSEEPAAIVALTVADIPSEEVLSALGIEKEEYADFWRALQFAELQAARLPNTEICKRVGVHTSMVYEPKWKRLIGAAHRLLLGRAVSPIGAVAVHVYEAVPDIIESIVQVALHAPRGADKVKAAEFLNTIFPFRGQDEGDSTPEHNYLKNPPNFSPQMPLTMLNVQPGGQVTIVNAPNSVPSRPEDAIEAEIVEDGIIEPVGGELSFAPKAL